MSTLKERLLEGNQEMKFIHQIFIDLYTMGLVPVLMVKQTINMQTEIISKSGRCCEGKQKNQREW